MEHDEKKQDVPLTDAEQFSLKVKEFKKTEHWKIINAKLKDDYINHLNLLIEEEDEEARGVVKYIQSFLSWFDVNEGYFEQMQFLKQRAKEDF